MKSKERLLAYLDECECKDSELRTLLNQDNVPGLLSWCAQCPDPALSAPVQVYVSGLSLNQCLDALQECCHSYSEVGHALQNALNPRAKVVH